MEFVTDAVSEINSGDGLGNGYGLAVQEELWIIKFRWYRVKWSGINEVVIGNVGGVRVCGDAEGLCGSNGDRKVSFSVRHGGNRCTRERNWRGGWW